MLGHRFVDISYFTTGLNMAHLS